MTILNIRRIMWEESGNKALDKPKIKSNGHNFKTFLLGSVESVLFSFSGVLWTSIFPISSWLTLCILIPLRTEKDYLLESSVTHIAQVIWTRKNGNKNCPSFERDLDYTAEITCQYWIEL